MEEAFASRTLPLHTSPCRMPPTVYPAVAKTLPGKPSPTPPHSVPHVRIIAFEPIALSVHLLTTTLYNLARNKNTTGPVADLASRVIVLPVGVGDKPFKAKLVAADRILVTLAWRLSRTARLAPNALAPGGPFSATLIRSRSGQHLRRMCSP